MRQLHRFPLNKLKNTLKRLFYRGNIRIELQKPQKKNLKGF